MPSPCQITDSSVASCRMLEVWIAMRGPLLPSGSDLLLFRVFSVSSEVSEAPSSEKHLPQRPLDRREMMRKFKQDFQTVALCRVVSSQPPGTPLTWIMRPPESTFDLSTAQGPL